jgi:KDO2-lipid IV(A) lauroyltransferase
VDPPLDTSRGVGETTQALADRFAAGIAAHPADWHMLQPLWTADLTAAQLARRSAAPPDRTRS